MGSHQATPEHFIRYINDIPADESSGVINVDTIQNLAQKAFSLFVNYLVDLHKKLKVPPTVHSICDLTTLTG